MEKDTIPISNLTGRKLSENNLSSSSSQSRQLLGKKSGSDDSPERRPSSPNVSLQASYKPAVSPSTQNPPVRRILTSPSPASPTAPPKPLSTQLSRTQTIDSPVQSLRTTPTAFLSKNLPPPILTEAPPIPALPGSRPTTAQKQKKHELFSVKVHLPRHITTILLCDETTSISTLRSKALDKLRLVLGITLDPTTVKLTSMQATEEYDGEVLLISLDEVKLARQSGLNAEFRVLYDRQRGTGDSSQGQNDYYFKGEPEFVRSMSMSAHGKFGVQDMLERKVDDADRGKVDYPRSRTTTNVNSPVSYTTESPSTESLADSKLMVSVSDLLNQYSIDNVSSSPVPLSLAKASSESSVSFHEGKRIASVRNNRKSYRPSSVYGVQHFQAQTHPVTFIFAEINKEIVMDVFCIYIVKREVWSHAEMPDVFEPMEQCRLLYAHPEGYMVELFDEQQFLHTISIFPHWVSTGKEFVFHVSSRQKNVSKHTQVVNKKIGNLIGYGLYRFDYLKDAEIDVFRRRMITVRQKALEKRDMVKYTFTPDVYSAPVSGFLSERLGPSGKIQFRLHVSYSQMVKTLTCSFEDTPEKIITNFIAKNKVNLPENCIATHFCIKVCGISDYLVGNYRMIEFSHIRKCILKEEKINLALVYVKGFEFPQNASFEEFEPIEDPCVNIGTHAQLTIEGRKEEEVSSISLWDIARNYRVQITACENLNFGNLETLYVEAGLYHGGALLCPLLKTHQVSASRNPRWGAWLNFDTPCYNLPRTARICITVWGRWNGKKKMSQDRENDIYPLGWVNMLLMDFKGYLRSGLTKLALWPGEKANPIGTCTSLQNFEEASIFLRLDSFAHPVIFPTENYGNDIIVPSDDIQPEDRAKLETLINTDPLAKLEDESREFLWKHRRGCLKYPQALPKVLLSTKWNVLDDVADVKKLLPRWEPMPPEAALELLDANFADMHVRAWAVQRLEGLSDSQVLDFLLQLVQALKYEPYLDSALGRFLLKRALCNKLVGHHFFWYLRSEMEDPSVSLRFALMLEAYVRGCASFMDDLIRQSEIISKLLDVATVIKRAKNNIERKDLLMNELKSLTFPKTFQLALDPRLEAAGLINDKCKFMDSKKLPLWCVFENSDTTGQDIYIIFKSGDDLRQDMLTLQMIRIMEKLWRNESLDYRMLPYGCISNGNGIGMIEVVLNAETVSNIQLAYGGSSAAFKDQPIDEWLRKQNPDEKEYEKAVDTFILSCAGYCVATYVLGIGDRHNDNIMVTKSGNLFHIDFGHFLGNIKKKFGFKRERAPFVLTPDFVYVMSKENGTESPQFLQFVDYCVKAYLILRRHSNMFINLFAMMLSTGIPELKSAEDIAYLREALCVGKSEEVASQEFKNLIFESLRLGWSTQLNWWLHNLVHSK